MELLRHLERKQLARQGCSYHILDGPTLAFPHSIWVSGGRRCRRVPLVAVVNVGHGNRKDFSWKRETSWLLEEDQ